MSGEAGDPQVARAGSKVLKDLEGHVIGRAAGVAGPHLSSFGVVRPRRRCPGRGFLGGSHLEVLRISGLSTMSRETWPPKGPSGDVLD